MSWAFEHVNITSDGRGYHPASHVGGVARLCAGDQHTYCMRRVWANIKAAVKSFGQHKVPRLAAALAYYTLFSLAPLLVIIIAVFRTRETLNVDEVDALKY